VRRVVEAPSDAGDSSSLGDSRGARDATREG
jgi:hypothetical protein